MPRGLGHASTLRHSVSDESSASAIFLSDCGMKISRRPASPTLGEPSATSEARLRKEQRRLTSEVYYSRLDRMGAI
ncbi:hypothetical protein Syun_022663 [Stephania yunnanensis]|uniref:Uncharacterized protein n=1 Tax=Stephania yunnanensis TaxID=152371 RepID=A0AAP0FEY8_9MAGN